MYVLKALVIVNVVEMLKYNFEKDTCNHQA